MSDGYLTPREAAAFCKLHYKTFLAIAAQEGLRPDAVFGTRKRYLPATLKQFGAVLVRRQAAATQRNIRLVLAKTLKQREAAS
jgi:hypothetical protein